MLQKRSLLSYVLYAARVSETISVSKGMVQYTLIADLISAKHASCLINVRTNSGKVGKTLVKKKPAQWVCLVFLGIFFNIYICPEERVFWVYSVSRILLGASRL
jgi:hypothetical protein